MSALSQYSIIARKSRHNIPSNFLESYANGGLETRRHDYETNE